MKIAVINEARDGERRVALVPESIKKLVAKGVEVAVQAGAGDAAFLLDKMYLDVGAMIESDAGALLAASDFTLMVAPPTVQQVGQMRSGAMLLTSLMPTINLPIVRALAERKISAFSTDAIPRTTRAQSMDTLSSMANIGGYKAVLIAASHLPKYFPMFMTAAGTVHPAKVFIIGAGVAGLQAIATAKRLGGNVTATDTRKAVGEQIQSLGAKFVGVESAEDAQTAELIHQQCKLNDVVITTALIGGVKAPKLITEEMVKDMQPGSVIVDLAATAGGNCTLTEPGRTVVKHGVTICAPLNLPAEMPLHGSTLYSRNLTTFVLTFWNDKEKKFNFDLSDDIIKGALITHNGEVTHGPTKDALAKQG